MVGDKISNPHFSTITTITRSMVGIEKPNLKYFNLTQGTNHEPKNVNEALDNKEWKQVMTKEVNALRTQGTYELVP